jgi:hypothetical protein
VANRWERRKSSEVPFGEVPGEKLWSQEQLAERSSIQRVYLANLERGYWNPVRCVNQRGGRQRVSENAGRRSPFTTTSVLRHFDNVPLRPH